VSEKSGFPKWLILTVFKSAVTLLDDGIQGFFLHSRKKRGY